MIPAGRWRCLLDEGLARNPRLHSLAPDHIAAIWREVGPEHQEQARRSAAEQGIAVEMFIRQRVAHARRVLTGQRKNG